MPRLPKQSSLDSKTREYKIGSVDNSYIRLLGLGISGKKGFTKHVKCELLVKGTSRVLLLSGFNQYCLTV